MVSLREISNRARRAGLLVLALSLCATSTGCFTYAVRSEHAKVAPYQSKTLHAYLWNLIENDPAVVAKNCGDGALSMVRAKTTYLYMLVCIVTIGGWVPMELEWRCAEGVEAVETP